MNSAHSKINGTLPFNKMNPRLQKENDPRKELNRTPLVINRTVKENKLAKEDPKSLIAPKLVKDNNLIKEDSKNPVVHNLVKEGNLASEVENRLANSLLGIISQEPPTLSIRLDVTSNAEVVKMADDTSDINNKSVRSVENMDTNEDLLENNRLSSHPIVEKGGGKEDANLDRRLQNDDYRSPLDAFGIST